MPPDTQRRRPAADQAALSDDSVNGQAAQVKAIVTASTDGHRDWRELWQPALSTATARCAERRRRVLSHPDLAELLTLPPLDYARPDQWTGYVPPALWGDERQPDGTFLDKRNTSDRRAALVAICAEAHARESGAT